MALAITSNKHHTHTHTSSHETRGNQSVVLPPANPPSLLLTAPPISPSKPPSQPSRRLSNTATTPPPPHGMPPAVCLKEALCARRKTHSCAAEPSSCVYIVTRTHTHTHTHIHITHSQRRLPERALVLLCPCETTIIAREICLLLQSYHHHIRHFMEYITSSEKIFEIHDI